MHVLTVLYYALLICILFNFIAALDPNKSIWFAFWIALLYMAHPVHTEVVANIKGRDELLHAIFALLSLRYVLLHADRKGSIIWPLLFFFLALLSKEMAVSLVLIVPLCLYFFRELERKKIFKITLSYVGVLILYFIIRQLVLDDITFEEEMSVLNNGLAAASNIWQQLATNLTIFGKYITLLVYPHPLAWDYSYPHFPVVNFSNGIVLLVLAVGITAAVFAIRGVKEKNPFSWAFFFFLFSFAIVSNFFILIGATLGERFLFFPSIAFVFALVLLIQMIDKKFFNKSRKYAIPLVAGVVIFALYGYKTYDRNLDWRSNEALFISGVEATPNNSRAVSALASVYRVRAESTNNPLQKQQNFEKARDYYLESVRLLRDNSESLYNLGVTYYSLGNSQKARLAYERVLELVPNHTMALNNLGVIYFQQSDFSRAEGLFLKALESNPDFANAHANLGAVYHNLGDFDKARAYYNNALRLNPSDVNTQRNLQKLNN